MGCIMSNNNAFVVAENKGESKNNSHMDIIWTIVSRHITITPSYINISNTSWFDMTFDCCAKVHNETSKYSRKLFITVYIKIMVKLPDSVIKRVAKKRLYRQLYSSVHKCTQLVHPKLVTNKRSNCW